MLSNPRNSDKTTSASLVLELKSGVMILHRYQKHILWKIQRASQDMSETQVWQENSHTPLSMLPIHYFLSKIDTGKSERKTSTELRKLLFQVLLILVISQINCMQQLSLVFAGDLNICTKREKNESAVPWAGIRFSHKVRRL